MLRAGPNTNDLPKIRKMFLAGMSIAQIAAKFQIKEVQVSNCLKNKWNIDPNKALPTSDERLRASIKAEIIEDLRNAGLIPKDGMIQVEVPDEEAEEDTADENPDDVAAILGLGEGQALVSADVSEEAEDL